MATKDSPAGKEDRLWWEGPDFLSRPEEEWPVASKPPGQILEVRRLALVREELQENHVADVVRISKWLVLVRATARVRVAVDLFRGRSRKQGELTIEDES